MSFLLEELAVNFGRLQILQWLKFADMLLPLACCTQIRLLRLNRTLTYLEAIHSTVHLHLV